MKICIPTETKDGMAAKVFGHFGSAPFFTVYDSEKKTVELIDNANQHHSHGMCQPLSALNSREIDVVVCGGMGGRAVQKLNEAGIKAFRAEAGSVEDIIKKVENKELLEITVENVCAQHGCH